MGKKNRSTSIEQKDVFQRINYLYQAAHVALHMNPPNFTLAQYYAATMKKLALRGTLKLSPHIKRTMCRKCCMLLLPRITEKLQFKKDSIVAVRCLNCNYVKRYPTKSKSRDTKATSYGTKTLWQDKEENIAKIVTLEAENRRTINK